MERKSLLCRSLYLPPLCLGHGRLSSGRTYHHINKDLQGCYIVGAKLLRHTVLIACFTLIIQKQ